MNSVNPKRLRAFSLIELLTVISLIATLAAMLFPVFAQVREKARQSTCASNQRQLGIALSLYASDYDDSYAYGADPTDKFSGIWGVAPASDPILAKMPLLPDLLDTYVKDKNVWRCPSDTGFDVVESHYDADGDPMRLDARPSLFEKFGSSYLYRTELAFRQVPFPAVGHDSQNKEHGPEEINVLMDADGGWHGAQRDGERRYNVLFADGHTQFGDREDKNRAWSISLK